VVQQAITSCHRFIVTVRTTDNRQLGCGTRRARAIYPLLLPWQSTKSARTIILLGSPAVSLRRSWRRVGGAIELGKCLTLEAAT
jgi:hypothetical protein